jgi:hypothetical protein
MNAVIALVFPYVANRSQSVPFFFFSAMMVVQFFVVAALYPETKNVTLEAIQKKLRLD